MCFATRSSATPAAQAHPADRLTGDMLWKHSEITRHAKAVFNYFHS
jgi:isocitrate dehydrogenase kinase/phosphatase